MDVDALLTLRSEIDKHLTERQRDLEQQLSRLRGSSGAESSSSRARTSTRGARSHPLKGAKVPPKYRGPEGETWAGRGAQPRWLTEALKGGRSVEEFLINKAAPARGKGAAKRSSRKRG
ncbi:MAG TPA: H-NS family nucleoid-associated regulatory protein [Burkholderiales bacterium]|nr:H-NS family nucleoid-associated regulatory protein [Burkholderiales bacterium]